MSQLRHGRSDREQTFMRQVEFFDSSLCAPGIQVGKLEFDRHGSPQLPGTHRGSVQIEYIDGDLQPGSEGSGCNLVVDTPENFVLTEPPLQDHRSESSAGRASRYRS